VCWASCVPSLAAPRPACHQIRRARGAGRALYVCSHSWPPPFSWRQPLWQCVAIMLPLVLPLWAISGRRLTDFPNACQGCWLGIGLSLACSPHFYRLPQPPPPLSPPPPPPSPPPPPPQATEAEAEAAAAAASVASFSKHKAEPAPVQTESAPTVDACPAATCRDGNAQTSNSQLPKVWPTPTPHRRQVSGAVGVRSSCSTILTTRVLHVPTALGFPASFLV